LLLHSITSVCTAEPISSTAEVPPPLLLLLVAAAPATPLRPAPLLLPKPGPDVAPRAEEPRERPLAEPAFPPAARAPRPLLADALGGRPARERVGEVASGCSSSKEKKACRLLAVAVGAAATAA
jgi:hypothetical protein